MTEHRDVPAPGTLVYAESGDRQARREAAAHAQKREQEGASNAFVRSEQVRDLMAGGTLLILGAVIAAVVGTILVVAWHHLTPWAWLDEEQLADLRTVLFSGAVVGAVSSYFQRHSPS